MELHDDTLATYKKADKYCSRLTKFMKPRASGEDINHDDVLEIHEAAIALKAAIQKIKTQIGSMQNTTKRCADISK